MQFTEIFIRKPVLSLVISLLILVVGIKSFFLLPVRLYPSISPSIINISTSYPGAPSELMESFVTTPLENSLGGIEGIDFIRSESKQNLSQITLEFKLGHDLTKAMSDVSNAVAAVREQLPKEILDPVINTVNPNENPILFISFSSKSLSASAITDYLIRAVQPKLQNVPGVSQSMIYASSNYAMRLWLDPKKMAAHQVTASDIINALKTNNVQAAPGALKSSSQTINITANTDLKTAAQFNNLIIRNEHDYLVRLSDVGHAVLGVESDQSSTSLNGNKKAVVLAILPLASANPLTVANKVKAILPEIQANASEDIKLNLIFDASKFIAESIHDVERTFFEACLFVLIVIFLFLGSLRATLIPLITIPLSILGVCAVMLILGYTLNALTLLAWVLAIGLVVDDAIVVLENIHRHIEHGIKPYQAAVIGAKEIGVAIVGMTLTLAAVYAPIGFINDMTGILFREFAFTLAASVVISGLVALTLSPMMCSKLLSHEIKPSAFQLKIDNLLNSLEITYKKYLTSLLKRRQAILGLAIVIYLACFGLFKGLASELAPQEDQGIVATFVNGPTSANLPYMEKYIGQMESIYKAIPEVAAYITIAGFPALNNGFGYLILKPWNERHISSASLIQSLSGSYWGISGIQALPFSPPALPGSSEHAPLSIVLKTTDSYAKLDELAKKIQAVVAKNNPRIPLLQSDLKMDLNQVNLNIDTDKAISLGVSMADIASSLNILIGEPRNSVFNWNGRSYKVIPQLYHNFMSTGDQLKEINVRNAKEELLPLANIVSIQHSVAPLSLNHFQQLRSVTLGGLLAPGYTVGEAMKYFEQISKSILPKTVQIDFVGESRQLMQAGSSMQQTFVLALIFIFLILAAQFESFRAPFIILLTVPLSLAGALLALHLTGGTLNIYTQIGLVTLIGLITKHGILIVEFANQLYSQQTAAKMNVNEAVIEAASLRLRPILMTTAAMLLAALPLAFAHGVGANSRSQLGWVIFGGMAIGTFFTLFILPIMYSVVYEKKPPLAAISKKEAEKS